PALLDVLKDEDVNVRRAVLAALGMRAHGQHVLDRKTLAPVYTQLLGDPDALLRVKAAEALWNLGQTKEAIPVLVGALTSRDFNVTNQATQVLQRVGPGHKEVVPLLVEALKETNQNNRYQVLNVLQQIGPGAAREAIPALVGLLKEKD